MRTYLRFHSRTSDDNKGFNTPPQEAGKSERYEHKMGAGLALRFNTLYLSVFLRARRVFVLRRRVGRFLFKPTLEYFREINVIKYYLAQYRKGDGYDDHDTHHFPGNGVACGEFNRDNILNNSDKYAENKEFKDDFKFFPLMHAICYGVGEPTTARMVKIIYSYYPNTSTLSDPSTICNKSDIVETGHTLLSPLPRILRHEPHAYITPFNFLNSVTFAEMSKFSLSGIVSNSDPSLIRKISTRWFALSAVTPRRNVFQTCSGLLDCKMMPNFI